MGAFCQMKSRHGWDGGYELLKSRDIAPQLSALHLIHPLTVDDLLQLNKLREGGEEVICDHDGDNQLFGLNINEIELA